MNPWIGDVAQPARALVGEIGVAKEGAAVEEVVAQVLHRVFDWVFFAPRLIRFLRRPIQSTDHQVFLILDNLNVHSSAKVHAWVSAHPCQIAGFYLPAYASELTPDEDLNGDLTLSVAAKVLARTKPARERRSLASAHALSIASPASAVTFMRTVVKSSIPLILRRMPGSRAVDRNTESLTRYPLHVSHVLNPRPPQPSNRGS